jgi:hypothetical protein
MFVGPEVSRLLYGKSNMKGIKPKIVEIAPNTDNIVANILI